MGASHEAQERSWYGRLLDQVLTNFRCRGRSYALSSSWPWCCRQGRRCRWFVTCGKKLPDPASLLEAMSLLPGILESRRSVSSAHRSVSLQYSAAASSCLEMRDARKDESRGLFWRRVLPDAYDVPAFGPERLVPAVITGHVAFELGPPVRRVDLRQVAVKRAAVPEAAVHENGEPDGANHNVGSDPRPLELKQHVLPEAKTGPMQDRPDADLRPSTCTPVAPHRASSTKRGWDGVRQPVACPLGPIRGAVAVPGLLRDGSHPESFSGSTESG